MVVQNIRARALAAGAVLALAASPAAAGTVIEEWNAVPSPETPKLAAPTLAARTTALLILDIEQRTCNAERRPRCLDTVAPIAAFLLKARDAGMPVVYSTTGAGSVDTILPPVKPINSGEPVVKASVDKFLGTELEKILKDRGIDTVVACGTAAQGAVLHTATGAAQRKFKIVLPVDCLSAEDLFTEKAAVWSLIKGPATGSLTTLTTLGAITLKQANR